MKTKSTLALIAISILIFSSCKKDKKNNNPAPVPPGPTDTYNPPPAGGGYYFCFKKNSTDLCWTKNFTDLTMFSSKLKGTQIIGFGKDTLVAYCDGKIYFGNVLNPSDFKSITCSKFPKYISCINKVIVCTAIDGFNYYLGYCDYKNGQTQVTYSLLNSGRYFTSPIQHTGTELIATAYDNNISASIVAYTRDGINWAYKGAPISFPTGSDMQFKNYSNVYYAIGNSNVKSTTDTSFATGSWTTLNLNINQNTSDTSGFYQSEILRKDGNNWVSYGFVYSNVSGNQVPAKNVSTDNGATFTTTLLNGLPLKQFYYAVTKTHVLAFAYDWDLNNGSYIKYVSTDFLNFTLVNSAVEVNQINNSHYVE